MKPSGDVLSVGDEVDVDGGPLVPGTTRGILMQLSATDHGAQAYVINMHESGTIGSRISTPAGGLVRTGRVAAPEEIRALRDADNDDDSEICHLVAESARLREFADVLDALRMTHPDAVRTLREWNQRRKATDRR